MAHARAPSQLDFTLLPQGSARLHHFVELVAAKGFGPTPLYIEYYAWAAPGWRLLPAAARTRDHAGRGAARRQRARGPRLPDRACGRIGGGASLEAAAADRLLLGDEYRRVAAPQGARVHVPRAAADGGDQGRGGALLEGGRVAIARARRLLRRRLRGDHRHASPRHPRRPRTPPPRPAPPRLPRPPRPAAAHRAPPPARRAGRPLPLEARPRHRHHRDARAKTSTVLQQAPPVAQPASKRAATASAAPTPAAGPAAKAGGAAAPALAHRVVEDGERPRARAPREARSRRARSRRRHARGRRAAAANGADENRKTPPDERAGARARGATKELG